MVHTVVSPLEIELGELRVVDAVGATVTTSETNTLVTALDFGRHPLQRRRRMSTVTKSRTSAHYSDKRSVVEWLFATTAKSSHHLKVATLVSHCRSTFCIREIGMGTGLPSTYAKPSARTQCLDAQTGHSL